MSPMPVALRTDRFSCCSLRLLFRNEVQHPILGSDDNQTSRTFLVGRVTNCGIVPRTSSSVTNDGSLHTDPPVKDDPDCVAYTINIKKHRSVNVCQRRQEARG